MKRITEFPINAVFNLAAFGNAKVISRYFDNYTLKYGPTDADSVTLKFAYLLTRPRVDASKSQD